MDLILVCSVAAAHRICLSLISPPSLERQNEVMSVEGLINSQELSSWKDCFDNLQL